MTDQPTGVLRFEPDAEGDPTKLAYTFGGFEPLVSVRPGTTVSTWTMDCFAGRVRSTSDLVSEVCDPRFLNPQTGPFFVEGAEPGDTLVVHFRSITPREAQGVSTTVPLFGSLTATGFTAMLHPPLPERTWVYAIDTAAGVVRYDALDSPYQVDLPLDPMHGTVGVAPALGEVRSSLTPGSWGGNMDTPEMRAGTTCYLGVNVPGALFSLGDGHARQGEGETCGVAVECAMDTVLVVDLVKGGTPTPWPRLEDDTFIMTTGSARPLEDAFRIAHTEMVRWVQELAGLSDMDAYQLVSQTALTPVANVVDTNYTVVAKVPKRVLPDVPVMQGMHARWRRT
ncbi:acetamidase/formamidase family protein [Nocardioides islandensis]|uniref:Acetamidase/formamidase family protein n=1 Tax=Nocardioides islandensis TaxID=433663 RepID=A0A930VHT6_9ACTN|nr:acetamidase/formamidase family protein [Nocardioides islandensis]MBF4765020.1 acetamidase/formamidase family protein [Nocardioides islandensis]